jgi:DNA-binding MarR family transcriptional regulator
MHLEVDIQDFLHQVSEKELLLGDCESSLKLTSTQEHILMLLARDHALTNRKISEALALSAAAVTKATKKLLADHLVSADRNPSDERELVLQLTERGKPIAAEHAAHHAKTLAAYREICKIFSEEEQLTIQRFLTALKEVIG